MKKKILSILMIGLISTSLIGCGGDKVNTNGNKTSSNRFTNTGDTYDIGYEYDVYYDNQTKIVYLSYTHGYGGSLSVIYNSEGKPMTIDEYNKTK
jgi:hypothetical protein